MPSLPLSFFSGSVSHASTFSRSVPLRGLSSTSHSHAPRLPRCGRPTFFLRERHTGVRALRTRAPLPAAPLPALPAKRRPLTRRLESRHPPDPASFVARRRPRPSEAPLSRARAFRFRERPRLRHYPPNHAHLRNHHRRLQVVRLPRGGARVRPSLQRHHGAQRVGQVQHPGRHLLCAGHHQLEPRELCVGLGGRRRKMGTRGG